MTIYIHAHTLKVYPASCLNRDERGRPKTVMFGGVERARISKQAQARADRTSPLFKEKMKDHLGVRTRWFETLVVKHLRDHKIDEAKIAGIAEQAANVFSHGETLAFISPKEQHAVLDLALRAAKGEAVKFLSKDILQKTTTAVDVALWGRMMTDGAAEEVAAEGAEKKDTKAKGKKDKKAGVDLPKQNRTHATIAAACSAIHQFTTHKAVVEGDYWSVMDDLPVEGVSGAGNIDTAYFTSGVFYGYWCINRDLLVSNLDGKEPLADLAVEALIETLAVTSPAGKHASFGTTGARAPALLVEVASHPFRNLSDAFVRPVTPGPEQDLLGRSYDRLVEHRDRMDSAYGTKPERSGFLVAMPGREAVGTLADVLSVVRR